MSLPSSLLRTARTSGVLPRILPAMGVKGFSAAAAAQTPVKVSVTGAAGQIGYSLLFRIASGQVFGNRPVILQGIELPFAMDALKGVKMELEDCAFPLLKDVVLTSDINVGFGDADYVFLVGSKPRGPGMERGDLLKDNGAIFQAQGKAINDNSKKSVKVLVVGNPANTNCLIAAHNAPNIDPNNFSAMTRLDHNRAIAQVVLKTKCNVEDVDKVIIWGNHSATQYPDLSHATIRGGSAKSVINDQKWIEETFIPDVQQRGAAIIKARKLSSAASAANGAIDHMRDWVAGTKSWTSMAVHSKGNPYGVDGDLYYSFPVSCTGNGNYKIVGGLKVDDFSAKKMAATEKELKEERDMVKHMFAY